MTISWRDKLVLAAIESSYGTPVAPNGSNAIYAIDVSISPMMGSDVDRNLDVPWLGPTGSIPAELHQQISFKVELAPSGTAGTPPAWGPLLRACACAQTVAAGASVTYNPVSTGHESVTLHLMIGGTLFAIPGARGTARLNWTGQAIPYLEFTFTGLYKVPVEAARPTPSYAAFQKPQLGTPTLVPTCTIDGVTFATRALMLDLANAVETRFLLNTEGVVITDREDALTATVEAVPMTTWNPFQKASDQAEVPVEFVHGTTAGRIATLDVPRAQVMRPEGIENSQNVTEWPLRLSPLRTTGDDQWTLELT
jgi:hypothetical protein